MYNATLFEYLKTLAARQAARFHMPGHKGQALFPDLSDAVFSIDYTEIPDTGNLYAGDEPILSAERDAARCFGAQDCLFVTGGSTQALMTALCAAVPVGGSLIVDRNCHRAVTHGMALLDVTPHFVFPRALPFGGLPGFLEVSEVEAACAAHPEATAVLVTSPNYYGVLQDIPALAAVCKKYGKYLLVDAAHGAHFSAVGLPSPVEQGADLAAVSTHKTLPALGQSAVLLSAGTIPFDRLLDCAPLFGTSSPSYLLMASIDCARSWLEGEGKAAYARRAQEIHVLRPAIREQTVFDPLTPETAPIDPCRLVIGCQRTTMTGDELADYLHENGIDVEMSDFSCAVLIGTPCDGKDYDQRLLRALRSAPAKQQPERAPIPRLPQPERVLSLRQAQFSPCERVPTAQAVGRICAKAVTPYPPGVPVVVPGERIAQVHVEFLTRRCYTKIREIYVVKEME